MIPLQEGEILFGFLGALAAIGSIVVPKIIKVIAGASKVAAKAKGLPVAVKAGAGAAAATIAVEAITSPARPPVPTSPFLGLTAGGFGTSGVLPGMNVVGAPQAGMVTDRFGRPMLVQAQVEQRIRCPPGYVAITMPDGGRACALKGPARAAGLWKSRRKPPMSAKDWRCIQVAARVQKKIKRIAKAAGVNTTRVVRAKSAARRSPSK